MDARSHRSSELVSVHDSEHLQLHGIQRWKARSRLENDYKEGILDSIHPYFLFLSLCRFFICSFHCNYLIMLALSAGFRTCDREIVGSTPGWALLPRPNYSHRCVSITKYNLVLGLQAKGGWWCSAAGKVTMGVVAYLLPICDSTMHRLTAKRQGLAPDTIRWLYEYRIPLPLTSTYFCMILVVLPNSMEVWRLRRIFETSDSVAGLKVEKLGGVVNGAGEWGDIAVERAPRDRRSLDILSVKKEAKLC